VRVLITGATGFVGTALVDRIVKEGRLLVRATVRRASDVLPSVVERVPGDLTPAADWLAALVDVSAVVHLAARVHVMREASSDPLAEFRRVNVAGTLALARQAAAAGVRRFVYLSSVKVNGESGAYAETDPPAPVDAYGVSKHEAEVGLRQIATATGMDVVIVRAPLVYGRGVGANFKALIDAVARGVPLPLGAIDNRRSLIALDNLIDFMLICLEHPAAANETYLVSDGEDLSTPDLVRRLARAMGRRARLIPVPGPLLMTAAALVGRRDVARRLLGSLQVDITKAKQQLGWVPPVPVDEGLRRTVALR
jgi:nucleoside-diphosphate-sugar epimerase